MPPAQTIKQAKAAYKKNGSHLSERQIRQNERGAELERRAQLIKDRDARRRYAQKQRAEREQRERESKINSGFGVATQLAGFSNTQKQMKRGMEAFVGFRKAPPVTKQVDQSDGRAAMDEMEFDLTEIADDFSTGDEPVEKPNKELENPVSDSTEKAMVDPWDEEELDEESLLEIADQSVIVESLQRRKEEEAAAPVLQPPHPVGSVAEVTRLPSSSGIETLPPSKPPTKQPELRRSSSFPWHPPKGKSGNAPFMKASVFRHIPQKHEWDDFLDSSTQIARDIAQGTPPAVPSMAPEDFFICTQDLHLSQDDLEEIAAPSKPVVASDPLGDASIGVSPRGLMAPPMLPARKPQMEKENRADRQAGDFNATFKKPSVSNQMLPPPIPPPKVTVQKLAIEPTPLLTSSVLFGFSTQEINAIADDEVSLSPV